MGKRIDLTGHIFERLTVISETTARHKSGAIVWECICSCGNTSRVSSGSLRSGVTQSCGCLGIERRRIATKSHGMSETPIYSRWEAIIQRCNNPNCTGYENYGGRGIGVCQEWLTFAGFYKDMGDIPYPGATIDRIDNDGDYCPENCEWAGYGTQAANTRVRKDSKTGMKGVQGYSAKKGTRFCYRIAFNGVIYKKCGFTTAEEAFQECQTLRKSFYNR